MTDVTILLNAIGQGNARTDELLPLVYAELRRLAAKNMRHEQPGHTLQATALVHEAFLRLMGNADATWQNRRHFFGAAALAMQRILVEQARRRQRLKHGGQMAKVELDDMRIVADECDDNAEFLKLDKALREFEQQEPEKAELVRLRYFAGLTEKESAKTLQISRATAARWWAYAKAWLFSRIQEH